MASAITTAILAIILALVSLACLALAEHHVDQSGDCNVPSRFWCDSEEIARKCGVYEKCQEYEWTLRQEADPVDFALYYEFLCPGCQDFIINNLYPAYESIGKIMNIILVPYGNARETKKGDHWVFDCQHGEDECLGNMIETCAISVAPDVNKYVPFVKCMEDSSSKPVPAAKTCASQVEISFDEIMSCANSSKGNNLEHEMAVKTDSLRPRIKFVPWVTVNGVHTKKIQKEAQNNLVKLICDTYKGTKPPQCSEDPLVLDSYSYA